MNKYEYALDVIEKHLPERNDTGYFVRMLEITEALETLKELVERYGKDDHV